MRLNHICRKRVTIHRKTVVHAGDLDQSFAIAPITAHTLHRMVRAAMSLVHLDGLGSCGERQHLMAQTNAEKRHIRIEQRLDHGHGIFAGCRRIARPVGQEHAIGLVLHNLGIGGFGWQHRHACTRLHQIAEDIVLRPEVERDDMRFALVRSAGIALSQGPSTAAPLLLVLARDALGQIHPFQPCPFLSAGKQSGNVKIAISRMRDHCIGRTGQADAAGQSARVHA